MLTEQAEYLSNQCFSGENGATYCVLKLVLWAKKHCNLKYIPVSSLLHEFSDPGNYSDEPDGSPEFIERALSSQNYPILVQETLGGKLMIMDGRHRLYKCYVTDKKAIPGYVIPEESMPESCLYMPSDEFDYEDIL